MTYEELNDKVEEMGIEDCVLFAPPLDYSSAAIGISEDDRVVYSYEKMVQWLVDHDGMTEEEAEEFIDYNTIRALPYGGEKSPIVVHDFPE